MYVHAFAQKSERQILWHSKLSHYLGCLHPIPENLIQGLPLLLIHLPANAPWRQYQRLMYLGPCHPQRRLGWSPKTPGLTPVLTGICEVVQQIEDLLLCHSSFHINRNKH